MSGKSRRFFLTGQSSADGTWSKFHQRLLQELDEEQLIFMSAPRQARFIPHTLNDLHAAFFLARHFEIKLALFTAQNVVQASQHEDLGGVLWIDPQRLNRCEQLDELGRFYVEPGCTMQQLAAAGLTAFSRLPGQLRIIEWLDDPAWQQGRAPQDSGVQMASLLLPDCSVARLAPFGVEAKMELNTPTLRRIVPQLFQLAGGERVQQLLGQPAWPLRYRLDIFADSQEVNLAYLILGQGTRLGWLQWAVLDARTLQVGTPPARPQNNEKIQHWVQDLEATVEGMFDPEGRFLALL